MNKININDLNTALHELRNPDDIFNWSDIAMQLSTSQPEISEMIYKKIIEIGPKDDPILLYNYALCMDRAGKAKEAEKLYRKVITINPNDKDAMNNLAMLLRKAKQFKESEALYKGIIAHFPSYHIAYNNYANLLKEMGLIENAKSMYKKALELSPTYSDAMINYAKLLNENGCRIEATEMYKKYMKYNPSFRRRFNRRRFWFAFFAVLVSTLILFPLKISMINKIILIIPCSCVLYVIFIFAPNFISSRFSKIS